MARLVPNDNTWVAYSSVVPTVLGSPTIANINAAIDLTPWCISINASAQGNTVPTPTIDTLFETSITGTSAATFTADFYRDNTSDLAWTTLPRMTTGVFYIARWGGSGANQKPSTIGNKVEVWPIIVTSRAAAALASNTAQTFTVTCAVSAVPAEDGATIA